MRIASWNILHGQRLAAPTSEPIGAPIAPMSQTDGEEQRANLAEIAQFIFDSKIDVIGIQEIDAFQSRSGEHLQVDEITKDLSALVSSKTSKYYGGFARTVIGTPGFSWRALKANEAAINFDDSEPSYGVGLISNIPIHNWHTLKLGRSLVGLPLAVPAAGKNGKPRMRFLYVKDEPRIALAAELENGVTVAVTHLSFVPLVNLYQLWRVKRWLAKLPGKHILMGDLNLPFNLPVRGKWKSLNPALSYPAWGAKVKFDYLLADSEISHEAIQLAPSGFSDHLPVVADVAL